MSNPKQITNAKPLPTPSYDDDTDSDDGLLMFRQLAESVALVTEKNVVTRTEKKVVTKRQVKSVKDRCRKRVSFWLEMDKIGQADLWEWFKELKLRREFASVIRIAVSLYRELLIGETYMLYELFPEMKPKPAPKPSTYETDELKKRVAILEGQVDILNQVIVGLKLPTEIDNAVKMTSVGQGAPKALTVNKAPAPLADDDDTPLVIRKDANAGGQAALNFIRSAFALNGMTYDERVTK